jgi:hypothetical protein
MSSTSLNITPLFMKINSEQKNKNRKRSEFICLFQLIFMNRLI